MSRFTDWLARRQKVVPPPTYAEMRAAVEALGGLPSRQAISEWVIAERAKPPIKTFVGISAGRGEIVYQGRRFPIAGVSARVETVGERAVRDRTRVTATRLVVLGVFALAAPKRKKVVEDSRALYLTVSGAEFEIVESVDPDLGLQAREFAAWINSQGRSKYHVWHHDNPPPYRQRFE